MYSSLLLKDAWLLLRYLDLLFTVLFVQCLQLARTDWPTHPHLSSP
jgi:hypothetical protein